MVVGLGLGLLLTVSLGPAAFVALFGRDLLYHPTGLTVPELDALVARGGWTREVLPVPRGEDPAETVTLQGVVRPAPASATWLLFFGGNAMPLDGCKSVLDLLGRDGPMGLASFAYRGYDGSEGKPTQRALLQDARAVVAHLGVRHGVRPESIVLIGQSLGSGVAAFTAAALAEAGTPVKGLVLLSPYTSMAAVFQEHLPVLPVGFAVRDRYPTETIIGEVGADVLIIHGTLDRLIPVTHARQLAASAAGRATLVELPGREHNDLWVDPRTMVAVGEFVRGRE